MLPERLKSLRLETKLTQIEVATKLKISQPTYSAWEKGTKTPTPNNISKISILFNVSTDYLLGNTDINNQQKLETDLNKSLDTFKAFDGKPMYDEDREMIREFLKKRMEDRMKK